MTNKKLIFLLSAFVFLLIDFSLFARRHVHRRNYVRSASRPRRSLRLGSTRAVHARKFARPIHRYHSYRRPYYWGPRYLVSGVGFWYYPGYGWWYHPNWYCYYYPWNYGWYFYRSHCWYYPRYHYYMYVAPDPERVVYLENDFDEDLYFAVYRRYKVGDGYSMYRVKGPEDLCGRKTIKIILPRRKPDDYVVVADRNKENLPLTVYKKASGELDKTKEVTISKEMKADAKIGTQITTADLSKKDKKKIKKWKKVVDEHKNKLPAMEEKIKKTKVKESDAKAQEKNKDREDVNRFRKLSGRPIDVS